MVKEIIHGPFEPLALDKTWKEIKDAFDNNIPVMLKDADERRCFWLSEVYSFLPGIGEAEKYHVAFMRVNDAGSVFKQYTSDTETGTLTYVFE